MKFAKARVFEELPLEFSQMNTSLASVAASRANDIRGVAEVLAAFSPESRADILAKIRGAESQSDQREAGISNLALRLNQIARLIPKYSPPQNPPHS